MHVCLMHGTMHGRVRACMCGAPMRKPKRRPHALTGHVPNAQPLVLHVNKCVTKGFPNDISVDFDICDGQSMFTSKSNAAD